METSENTLNLAELHKEVGNVAYRKKDYLHALHNFKKAVLLSPHNIVYRNNIAAVYFRQGLYKECLSGCEEAYEVGLQHEGEDRNMARCLYRMSCCHLRLDNPTTAHHYAFIADHHHHDYYMKNMYLKFKEEFETNKTADIYFQNGKFPEAVNLYSKVVQLEPSNTAALSNRACCYAKLLEFSLSIGDCDKVLEMEPDNVKMLVRKGSSLLALRKHDEAERQFVKAWSLDRSCQEALEGVKRSSGQKNLSAEDSVRYVLQDPKVRVIMQNPQVKAMLQRVEGKPTFVLRNHESLNYYDGIDKLVECGLVRLQGIT